MDDRLFRNAMGKFATGITIVSIDHKGERIGMTVNAFMSVSLEPKLIAISIDEKASMYNKLQEAGKFGLSILAEEQKELSMIFAKQIEKDREIPYTLLNGVPVIEKALAAMSCKVRDTFKAGDHLIFIAEVTNLTSVENGNPLLFFGSNYHKIGKK